MGQGAALWFKPQRAEQGEAGKGKVCQGKVRQGGAGCAREGQGEAGRGRVCQGGARWGSVVQTSISNSFMEGGAR